MPQKQVNKLGGFIWTRSRKRYSHAFVVGGISTLACVAEQRVILVIPQRRLCVPTTHQTTLRSPPPPSGNASDRIHRLILAAPGGNETLLT